MQRCDRRPVGYPPIISVGPGYWVWLIPLSSGSHSVGIVADARLHPLATMNTFERAMEVAEPLQPRARRLEASASGLQDFAALPRILLRLQAGFRRALGADGRGRPVPRPLLLAR